MGETQGERPGSPAGPPAPARARPSRRVLLAALGAAGLGGAAGCGPGRPHMAPPDPAATQPYRSPARRLVLQVLAHPDDDLYFMNPDTLHDLRAGTPVVSVYVTGGESTGANREPYAPRRGLRHDRAAYSSARHQGLRQAYAAMLGRPHFTPWRREVVPLVPGIAAEADVLEHVTLVHLQVSMHELSATASLPMMWAQRGVPLPYVHAQGAPAAAAGHALWTHDRLVAALAGLMERYRPTHVRTLDPDPDAQVHDRLHPRDDDQPGYSDHRDHTAAALFAWKAMTRWVAAATARDGAVPAFTTAAYRGYYNERWPFNLPPATVALKGRFLFEYGGDQRWACGNPGGCGDYGQGRNQPLQNRKGWVRSTHPRYPGTTAPVGPGVPGTRSSYQVLGLRAVRRRESAPGVWGEPEDLGGGPLAPALSLVRDAGGRHLLFALRFAVLEGDGGGDLRDVVVWRDDGTGWSSLGTPDRDGDRGRRTGSPVAVAAADGRVHLFARNAAKGVSTRVLSGGAWSPWRDLGGAEVQEGLAVLADTAGRVHVLAAGRDTVHHWAQPAPGAPVALRPPAGLPRPAGPPAAAASPDGSIRLTYPLPASARLHRAVIAVARA